MNSILKHINRVPTHWLVWTAVLSLKLLAIGNGQEASRFKGIHSEKGFKTAVVFGTQSLKLLEGEMPIWTKDKDPHYPHHYNYRLAMYPYIVLDGEGFAIGNMSISSNDSFGFAVALAEPPTESVRGSLFVPDANYQRMIKLKFEIPPSDFSPEKMVNFNSLSHDYYMGSKIRMSLYSMAGTHWYRMQSHVRQNRVLAPREVNSDPTTFGYNFMDKSFYQHESFELDILKEKPDSKKKFVEIADLPQPSVQQIDCKLDSPGQIKRDALATSIPADQWSVFFPTVSEAASTFERFRSVCSRFNWTFRTGSVLAADMPSNYEKQLAIDSRRLAKEILPSDANSVAITGSDFAFCMGTDVALVIEAKEIEMLDLILLTHREKVAHAIDGCRRSDGDLDGVPYSLFQNNDRSISSYQMKIGSRVVVSNSREQLKRLVAVQRSEQASIQNDELYSWLRHRYPITDANESGLLVVTEPCVRRLASPRWRVAEARRWVAAAFQKELQARYLARDLLGMPFDLEKLASELRVSPEDYVLVNDQVQHRLYGSNTFSTPVIEIPVANVTEGEAKAYGNWLPSSKLYSSLDPMGIRFENNKERFLADISFFPTGENVNYFNLDLYPSSEFPLQSVAKRLLSEKDQVKILTWRNLFVLNELRRQFPKQNPVQTFKQLTGRNVVSVPGGNYRWNPEWQTMECSVVGCPGSFPSNVDEDALWGRILDVQVSNSREKNVNRVKIGIDFDTRAVSR